MLGFTAICEEQRFADPTTAAVGSDVVAPCTGPGFVTLCPPASGSL